MLQRNINLNWLRSFESAARHLSFTAAAHELSLTQTAISQHIKALEQKLGQQLFIRRAKSLRLTDVGEAYLPSVRDGLNTIGLSTRGLFGPDLANHVIIRASMACNVWLSSQLATLCQQHPQIGVQFVTSIWPEATKQKAADLDIILAPQKHAGAHLEKLSDESIVPVCGSQTASSIKSLQDLEQLDRIHILGFDDHWARYLAAFDIQQSAGTTRHVVDTSVAAGEMVQAGMGGAMLIERFATQAIQTGRDISIVGASVPLGQSHYIARNDATQAQRPEVEAVIAWLKQCFTPRDEIS
ncbi:HTH-type transcriptional activator AmpR [Roseovarius albus]|uniref:HTH-type transcriptional activator AmpR n=1 Tax=Roseovarius albus TaxID=1247867 RepID=A0A1X6YFS8_9RHOB|nr:LysR family transcriptional regulator [Roseovarius albus]SLN19966.1 HTH-type transcriptional activator AmpR [Roseovarius albus]